MDHFPGIVYFSLVLFPERAPVMAACMANFTPCLRLVFLY